MRRVGSYETRRVVVTGMGIHCALGHTPRELFDNLIAGKSGVGYAHSFDPTAYGLPKKIAAAEIRFGKGKGELDLSKLVPEGLVEKTTVIEKLLYSAGWNAVKDAGLVPPSSKDFKGCAHRYGTVTGGTFFNYEHIEEILKQIWSGEKNAMELDRYALLKFGPPLVPYRLTSSLGFQGPSEFVGSACSTGLLTTVNGAKAIKSGQSDVMLCGSGELFRSVKILLGFMFERNQYCNPTKYASPVEASRPFDTDVSGVCLGDGASYLVLEEYEHARARGAKMYAEITGWGQTQNNLRNMYAPDTAMEAACMKLALINAKLLPEEIGYVNPHGTGTKAGDAGEVAALRDVFGRHVESDKFCVSATKSATSHAVTGAGTLENIISIMTLNEGMIPPTLNLHNPKPECAGIDFVPLKAKKAELRNVLKSAFGMGGYNIGMVFSRVDS